MTRGKTWVKISKIMPQPRSISPRKGWEALRQNAQKSKSFGKNMVWFNRTHSFPNLQAKFFKFMFCTSVKFTANYANSTQFAPNIPHHLLIHYVLDACPRRELPKIPVNYADSMQFTHIHCELSKIRINY